MTRTNSRFSSTRATLIARCLPFVLATACATPPAQTAPRSEPTRRATSLTATDLQAVKAMTTLDAVRQLRPDFLRVSSRADRNATAPAVYVNGMLAGGLLWLESIQLAEVREITFFHPMEARFRFGPTCPCDGGIVAVQTVGQDAR
jgi:hypothetical protein